MPTKAKTPKPNHTETAPQSAAPTVESDLKRLAEIQEQLQPSHDNLVQGAYSSFREHERKLAALAMEAFQIRLKEIAALDTGDNEDIYEIRERLTIAEKVLFLSKDRRKLAKALVGAVERGDLDDSYESSDWKVQREIEEKRGLLLVDLYSLRTLDLDLMLTTAKVAKANTGTTSPAEEFLNGVLYDYNNGLLPETVEHYLQEFRSNLNEMGKTARQFAKMYPTLMEEPAEVPDQEEQAQ